MRGHAPIPTEGRLLRGVRRIAEHARNATLIAKLAPDPTDDGPKHRRPTRHVDAADERTLRGIPAIGRGVAGVSPGTRPDAITDREDTR